MKRQLPGPAASADERRQVHRSLMALLPDADGDFRGLQALAAALRRSLEAIADDVERERAQAAGQRGLFEEAPPLLQVMREVAAHMSAADPDGWELVRAHVKAQLGLEVP